MHLSTLPARGTPPPDPDPFPYPLAGPCLDPVTHNGKAAWICNRHVKFFDGTRVTRVGPDRADIDPVGLRLQNGRLAWIEVYFGEPPDYGMELGDIRFWDGQSIYEVATIALPCMYCDAYWPPIEFSFSGDLLAWSYAMQPDDPEWPWYGDGNCAYARIIETITCPDN